MRYLFDSREWNFVRNFVTGRANYTSDEWRSDFRGFIEARNTINFTLSNYNEFWLNFLIIIIIENCVKQLFEKKNTFIILKFLANSIKDNINKEWLEQYKYKYQFICFNDYFYKICKVQNNSFPRMKESRDCLSLPTSSSHSRLCNTRGCIHVRIQTPRSGYKCGSTCLEALRCALIRHRVNEVVDLHPVPNERVPGRESSGRKVEARHSRGISHSV